MSISHYFTEMLDSALDWDDVAAMVQEWDGQFCLKGIMSGDDAKRAPPPSAATGVVVVSNHGGRQLDGSRARLRTNSRKSSTPPATVSTS